MGKRTLLLLSVVLAMLLAYAGVVLAQNTTPEEKTISSEQEGTSEAQRDSAGRAPLQERGSRAVPDQYIVVLKDDARDPRAKAREHAQNQGAEVLQVYEHALKGFAARLPAQALERVRNDPEVQFVSEDREEQLFTQTMPTGINRVDADASTNSTQAGNGSGAVDVDIAVLDTGIYKHSDLNVRDGYNCSSTNRRAWSDKNGHGTHVAGSAAAKDDGAGVVGVAPGARLWAIKVFDDSGRGTTSSLVCGIDWVTGRNTGKIAGGAIEVANYSGGGAGEDDQNCGNTNNDAKHKAICTSVRAGATYAVAAGNGSTDASKLTPAAYDEVITVSNLADFNGEPGGNGTNSACSTSDADDTFRSTSNYGADVDLGAPGTCIYSTVPGGGFGYKTGTSMASPHVAGAAALYKVKNPSATPNAVRTGMVESSNTEALGSGHTDSSGKHPEPVMMAKNY